MEQLEWDDLNKLLQGRGFKPVFFADPVENRNLADLVLLDKRSAGELRTTLRTMLMDSERRQALIQELVMSNNQLKEEVQKHVSRAAQQSQRASELEGLLDQVKTRVQDLEDRHLDRAVQQHSLSQQLQHEHKHTQKRCQLLEQKLSKQKEEMTKLRRKLYFATKEEERRSARRSRIFQRICGKTYEQNSAADERVLDVIDFYEAKVALLLDELRSAKGSKTKPIKTILEEYQEQQKKSNFHVKELKREVDCLKQELDRRLPKEDDASGSNENDRLGDPQVCLHYRHLLTEITALVTNPDAPLRLGDKCSADGSEPADFGALLPALEEWARQLQVLKVLQSSVSELSARLLPRQPRDGGATEAETLEETLQLMDTLLKDVAAEDEQKPGSLTRLAQSSMVSHFQKLFDVPSLGGVYPRMTEVYVRLGEMTNAMRTLRDLLDLDSRSPPAQVVDHVARLVSPEPDEGLHGLLTVDSVVTKLRQHEEFFPAFHGLVTEMFRTLGVSHLDDVLPALKSLKQTAQQLAA